MVKISNQLNFTFKKTLTSGRENKRTSSKSPSRILGKITNIRAKDLIFIDESGVNLAMVRLQVRALKDKRVRGKKPLRRGTTISLIFALSSPEVVALINIYGAANGITLAAFILRESVPKLWQGACVVMDNAKIHCGKMVKKFIEEAKAKLIYFSLYSPDFSPIGNFWSKVKSLLRKLKARNY